MGISRVKETSQTNTFPSPKEHEEIMAMIKLRKKAFPSWPVRIFNDVSRRLFWGCKK
jgi:hypothetical protein